MQIYKLPNFSVVGSLQTGSDMRKVTNSLWQWRKENININGQLSTKNNVDLPPPPPPQIEIGFVQAHRGFLQLSQNKYLLRSFVLELQVDQNEHTVQELQQNM